MLFQNNSLSSLDIGLGNRQSDTDTVWGQAMKCFKSTKSFSLIFLIIGSQCKDMGRV